MILPEKYAWLQAEGGPKMLLEAIRLFGTLEVPGATDNPTILAWAKEVGLTTTYSSDSIPWCGLFMAVVAKRADKAIVPSPLWALSWRRFGVETAVAMLGDVLVYRRDGGGHVNLYVGEDRDAYHGIGGNQSDGVNVVRIHRSRLVEARRPLYRVQPANVRRIMLSADGSPLSADEV